jgi:hypothetical protein
MANTLVMDVQEQLFPSADMVQNRDHIQLAKDKKCGKTVLEKYPRFGSLEEAIAKSLYIWFGCVQIDKALYFYFRSSTKFDQTTQQFTQHWNEIHMSNSSTGK